MKKQRGIIYFLISLVLIAAVCFIAAFGIGKENKGSAKNIVLGLDLKGGVSITYEVVGDSPSSTDFNDTINKLKKRVMEFSTEADVYSEGDRRITVDIPGEDDAGKVLDELGKPGSIQFITDYEAENEKVWLGGEDIKNATPSYKKNETTNQTEYIIQLEMTPEATTTFKELTTQFIQKQIYIVYDGEVLSAPYIQAIISDGKAQVDGMEDFEEAEELASMIRIGSLKLELEDISSKVVGAKLGKDALSTSLFAGLIGFAIIVLFMLFVYRIPGVAASLALVMYVSGVLVLLNGFDATLTLPGIAGIILSIGMAVDANVIIYARIKEEIAEGVAVETAIKTGFNKATSAIVDGNVTTLIAAVILWYKGSGTVQGFAQTLAIGIVFSMFTAMVISRLLIKSLYAIGFKDEKFYGKQKLRKTIDFLKYRKVFFAISLIAALTGITLMGLNQSDIVKSKDGILNYSVEFKGGLATTVEFDKDYTIDDFNSKIKPEIVSIIGDEDVTGNDILDSKQLAFKSKIIDEEKKSQVKKMLIEKFGALEDSFEEVSISSTISDEMKEDAITAILIAVALMLLYIFIRFRDIRFASSAVIALVHDVMAVLTFYVLSWTSVGNTFIACMLTILGYSINATIVIFDRIRENLAENSKNVDLKEVVNRSITQTLTRSIYTSLTTGVMVIVLYILGVTSIKEFALPLIIGIIVGAYSSVLITGALWYTMAKKKYSK